MKKISSEYKANTQQIPIDFEQFWEYLDWIELFDALEIHVIFREKPLHKSKDAFTNPSMVENIDEPGKEEEVQIDLLIPYLMNDCVESILTIHDCIFSSPLPINSTLKVPLHETFPLKDACFLEIEGTDDLILQLPEQVISLRCDHISIETHCYQYHNIGHNWRQTPGEEHIRRMVNLICIIYDKYRYLGEDYTNEIERSLAPLIEFGPFAQWSPINSSMLEWYSETPDGIQAMKQIAVDAGDSEYYQLLCEYEKMPLTSSQRKMHSRILSSNLVHPAHAALYQTILDRITEASAMWEIRNYDPQQALTIQTIRENVVVHYLTLGYEGTYPHFKTYDKKCNLWTSITFVEQHPFTRLESKGYLFKIFAMEITGPDSHPPYNDYGFFHEVSAIGWSGRFYEVNTAGLTPIFT